MDKQNDDVEFGVHANARMQQRGIRPAVAHLIMKYADREIYVGKGLTSVSVSKRWAIRLGEEGKVRPDMVEKLTGKSVVVANDNTASRVVTVMHVEAGQKGRHHRKRVKLDRRKNRNK